MPVQDFLPYAIGATANVTDQATWAGSTVVTNGMLSGYAKSKDANKAIRQPSFISAGLAQWVWQELATVDIRDDANLAEWVNNLDAALRKLVLSYIRLKPTASVNVYVSTFTGNDANSGISTGSPFKTIQAGVNYMLNAIDLGPQAAYIHVEGGPGAVYNETVNIGASPLGFLGLGQWQMVNYNGQVAINGVGVALNLQGGAALQIVGDFLLSGSASTTAPNGVICCAGAARCAVDGITFGNSPGMCHVVCGAGGEFNTGVTGKYSIAGGADFHWRSIGGGRMIIGGGAAATPITLQGTPAFAVAFASAEASGTIFATQLTFPGTAATGVKYRAFTNGVITTNGGGASYLPGSSAGFLQTGGQYV